MSLLLGIVFVLVMAFLVQFMNQYFGLILSQYSHLEQYLFFVVTISLMYLVKIMVNYALGIISQNDELSREYLFTVFVFSQTIGVILFPFAVCLQLTKYPTEWFLYPALVICTGFYALRMFRGFIISVSEQGIGILYIFYTFVLWKFYHFLVLVKFLLVNF